MADITPVLGDGSNKLASLISAKNASTAQIEPSQPDPPATSGGQIVTGAIELDRANLGQNRAKPGALRNVNS